MKAKVVLLAVEFEMNSRYSALFIHVLDDLSNSIVREMHENTHWKDNIKIIS